MVVVLQVQNAQLSLAGNTQRHRPRGLEDRHFDCLTLSWHFHLVVINLDADSEKKNYSEGDDKKENIIRESAVGAGIDAQIRFEKAMS